MAKYRKSVWIIILIFSLNGLIASNNGIGDFNLTKSNTKNGNLIYYEKNSNETFFNKIGIVKKGEKIIIDLNKTQKFLQNFAKKLQQEGQYIKEKAIKVKDIGIKQIDKDKILIDINKTKNILEKTLEIFQKVIKESFEDLNKSR